MRSHSGSLGRVTFLRVRPLASIALALSFIMRTPAQQSALRYAGTVGQQHVIMVLELSGEAVGGGHYAYGNLKSAIRIVDSRQFGTTLVLQDEDGNILHLHFEDAAGEKTGSLNTAAMLEGTLDRGELDLPVKLSREEHE